MKVIWKSSSRYASFFNRDVSVISLISDFMSEKAIGRSISRILLVVTDENFNFCDLELKCDGSRKSLFLLPENVEIIEGVLEVEVSVNDEVECLLNLDAKNLMIKFGDQEAIKWLKLKNGVLIGLSSTGFLSSIICKNVIVDPDGSKQSKWISWVEAKNRL